MVNTVEGQSLGRGALQVWFRLSAADVRSAARAPRPDLAKIEIIAPNLKRRLSGVTSTIVQLVPLMSKSLGIATIGPGLPEKLPKIFASQLPGLWRRPISGRKRIWHARRNVEMVAGIVMKSALRMPLHLVFTSVAQRKHRPFTKWLIRRMDRVIATSTRAGAYLDVPHSVIMHGVDLDAYHPARSSYDDFAASKLPGKYGIGCFGRVRHQKGTDLFVDAMIELLPDYPEWTAVICGRVTVKHAGFAADLKRRVAEADLTDRIVFLGEVPDVKHWYRRMSVYVAPSRNEGFGLTPLEAMASCTAVVASDAGSYAEVVVPGTTGLVVPAGDGPALKKAIAAYLANPGLAEKHGQNALRHVTDNFGLAREANAIEAVYRSFWSPLNSPPR